MASRFRPEGMWAYTVSVVLTDVWPRILRDSEHVDTGFQKVHGRCMAKE
jgi:hypothetical protein